MCEFQLIGKLYQDGFLLGGEAFLRGLGVSPHQVQRASYGSTLLVLTDLLHELPWCDDLNVLPPRREVDHIAGHKEVGLAFLGACKDHVVVGIGAGDDHIGGLYPDALGSKPAQDFQGSGRWNFEARTIQDVDVLCK